MPLPTVLVSLTFPLTPPPPFVAVAFVPVATVYPSEEARRRAAQTRMDGTALDGLELAA